MKKPLYILLFIPLLFSCNFGETESATTQPNDELLDKIEFDKVGSPLDLKPIYYFENVNEKIDIDLNTTIEFYDMNYSDEWLNIAITSEKISITCKKAFVSVRKKTLFNVNKIVNEEGYYELIPAAVLNFSYLGNVAVYDYLDLKIDTYQSQYSSTVVVNFKLYNLFILSVKTHYDELSSRYETVIRDTADIYRLENNNYQFSFQSSENYQRNGIIKMETVLAEPTTESNVSTLGFYINTKDATRSYMYEIK